jgi:hypothetical protein
MLPKGMPRWQKIEASKRRLTYSRGSRFPEALWRTERVMYWLGEELVKLRAHLDLPDASPLCLSGHAVSLNFKRAAASDAASSEVRAMPGLER